jgi:hypothetical protein
MEIREERRPLAPQFTLRWLLGVMTVCAFLFAVFGSAARGHAWAIGVSTGIAVLAVMPLIYAMLFGCASVAGAIAPRRHGDQGESPFQTTPATVPPTTVATNDSGDAPIDAEIVP